MKAKTISTATHSAAARSAVHRIEGATGLYLKKGENGAGMAPSQSE
jgi:hypothetical protein